MARHPFVVPFFLLAASSAALTGCTSGGRPAPARTVTATATATVTATASVTATATVTREVTVAPVSAAPVGLTVGQSVGGGGDSVFSSPASPVTKHYVDDGESYLNCDGLLDAGYQSQGCVEVHSALGTAVGLVELDGTRERDLVYTIAGSTARLALTASRSVPAVASEYYNPDATRLQSSDLAEDNTAKLIFYTPIFSTTYVNAYESIDVIEASGDMVLHRDLNGGVARQAFGGGLEEWVPTPASVVHAVIKWSGGAWRVTVSEYVRATDVPSQTGTF